MRNSGEWRGLPLRPGLALLIAGVTVAGCASLESVTGPIGGMFSWSGSGEPPPPQRTDVDCPQITVRTGASTWQVPSGATGASVRYQATIGQLARECAILGDTMTIKVGVEGRVLVGPRGGPGSVTVPLRVAVVHEGPQPRSIWTKFYSIPVNIAGGTTQAIFAQVEDDLTFQLPVNRGDLTSYIVYVGFDPQAAIDAQRAKQKAPPRKARPKPKAKAKAAEPAPAGQPPAQQPGFVQPPAAPPPGVFAPPPPPPAR
jgi:hypothetical protein